MPLSFWMRTHTHLLPVLWSGGDCFQNRKRTASIRTQSVHRKGTKSTHNARPPHCPFSLASDTLLYKCFLVSFRSCHWTHLYKHSLSRTSVSNLTYASHNKKGMPSNRKWFLCTKKCNMPMRGWVLRTGASVISLDEDCNNSPFLFLSFSTSVVRGLRCVCWSTAGEACVGGVVWADGGGACLTNWG